MISSPKPTSVYEDTDKGLHGCDLLISYWFVLRPLNVTSEKLYKSNLDRWNCDFSFNNMNSVALIRYAVLL